MNVSNRHWVFAVATALLLHAGLALTLFSRPTQSGAENFGGVIVSVGLAGGAPGSEAALATPVEQAETTGEPPAAASTEVSEAPSVAAEEAVTVADIEPSEVQPTATPTEVSAHRTETVSEIMPPATVSAAATVDKLAEPPDLEPRTVQEALSPNAATVRPDQPTTAASIVPVSADVAAEPLPEATVVAAVQQITAPELVADVRPEETSAQRAENAKLVDPPPAPPRADESASVTATAVETAPVPPRPRAKPVPPTRPAETEDFSDDQLVAAAPQPVEATIVEPVVEQVAAPAVATTPSPSTAVSDTVVANEVAAATDAPPSQTTGDQIAAVNPSALGAGGVAGRANNDQSGEADLASGAGDPNARMDFMSQLQAWLERHKEYPRRARTRRQQGTAHLYFIMDRDGRVTDFRVEKSSGHSILDGAVLDMITAAQPLPKIPDSLPDARLEVVVPVEFFLN